MMAGGEVVLRKSAVGCSQRSRLSNITNFGPKGGVGNLRFGDEQKLCKSWNEGSVNGSSHATVHLQHQQVNFSSKSSDRIPPRRSRVKCSNLHTRGSSSSLKKMTISLEADTRSASHSCKLGSQPQK